jgi:hypothetical protein
MVKLYDQTLDVHAMITHRLCYGFFPFIHSDLFLSLLPFKPKTVLSHPCYILVTFVMALVVRLEPNGCQALLSHDDAIEDLKSQGWDAFLKIFEGYNLQVAKAFAQTFDGCREKIGDTQLEVTEEFVSEAIGLPSTGEKWFKNSKIEEVPWSLFMTSRKINCCEKGIPISLVKPRWHGLLLILKQFVTCEGRYGLVFLYHI